MTSRLTSAFLATALILGQLAFLQHALDLNSHLDGEPCEQCLLTTGLDHALEQARPPAEYQPDHYLAATWLNSLHPRPVFTAFLARAPPHSILPI